ncbi:variable surface family protein [Brachyspira murdochii]|uniref:Cell surface protein n=1 Tax=Brachyspira murdochii TaxID=84378 RepID=A0ABX5B5U8_9SPIR|nr:variable surface family protein [Brachyspira murdochii]PPS21682.1 cell surface protein [Brachyspira murdochii]
MKKVLLTAMAIVTLASASAFGMYGNGDSWIDFLVHGNQFRARMDQLGFTLGNGTIKGTFGFRANISQWGSILVARTGDNNNNNNFSLNATLSAGIGYTSDAFGIGVGYNYTMKATDGSGIHTPVLTINALNDNLRIAIPFQIAAMSKDQQNAVNAGTIGGIQDYMGIRTDIQIRYYTGIDAFNAIRLYVKYGQSGYTEVNTSEKFTASSLGLQLRLYFLNTTVGNVNVNPYIKLVYNQAIKGSSTSVASYYTFNGGLASSPYSSEAAGDTGAYDFTIAPVLGLGANSDVVSVWFEPSLGYTVSGAKNSALTHKLAWGAYAELYLTPVEDLEWYFELDVNNTDYNYGPGQSAGIPVYFETTTGITWYLPSLGGEQ